MIKKIFFVGSLVIIVVALVATTVGAVGGMGTPARIPPAVTNGPEDVDETFYVVAYHWGWTVFTEDGTELDDQIRLTQGTTVEIYAVNDYAQDAILKLPAPVAEAILAIDWPGHNRRVQGEPLWLYLDDHGFLIHWYSTVEYLAFDADEPTRVVFTADRPGEYNFQCTNYCDYGHTSMSQTMLIVE